MWKGSASRGPLAGTGRSCLLQRWSWHAMRATEQSSAAPVPESQECLEPGCGQWKIRHRDLRLGLLEPRQKPEKNEDLCHSPGFFGLKTCGSLGNNMDLNTQPYGSELDSNWTELALLEMNTSVGIRETDAWCPEKSSVSPRTGNSWSWSSAHAGQGFGLVFQNEEEYSSQSLWGLPGVTREFLYPLRFW